jgi:hypothetical protein
MLICTISFLLSLRATCVTHLILVYLSMKNNDLEIPRFCTLFILLILFTLAYSVSAQFISSVQYLAISTLRKQRENILIIIVVIM